MTNDFPCLMFGVGHPNPFTNPAGGLDAITMMVIANSLNVTYYLNHSTPQEIDAWQLGKLQYGVFIRDLVPFFLLDFVDARWPMDVPLNIHAMMGRGDTCEDYLEAEDEANLVTLVLVDAATNVVKALRPMGIAHSVSAMIRYTCQLQLVNYQNADDIGAQMRKIMEKYDTRAMINEAHMFDLCMESAL